MKTTKETTSGIFDMSKAEAIYELEEYISGLYDRVEYLEFNVYERHKIDAAKKDLKESQELLKRISPQ